MTPTPTIKSITLSDGTRLEDRGEKRRVKKGDWYKGTGPHVLLWDVNPPSGVDYTILSPVEAPAGGIERRGDWNYMKQMPLGESSQHRDLNPLIDAACAVVNSMAYTDPVAGSALAKLAATLVPFTQAVKEERFVVRQTDGGTSWWVFDINRVVATFTDEQDANRFAAMKNSQEGE